MRENTDGRPVRAVHGAHVVPELERQRRNRTGVGDMGWPYGGEHVCLALPTTPWGIDRPPDSAGGHVQGAPSVPRARW